jgi:hypothetical protein
VLPLVLLALLPAPHSEARLFSDGWGAANFTDPSLCITPAEGQTPTLVLFDKTPVVAGALDRLSLALLYFLSGLLLPVLALVAMLHPRGAGRHPRLLVFGLLGLAPAWFQWPLNPAFIHVRQWLAEAWIERWPLAEGQLDWLDGISLAIWLTGGTLLAGGTSFLATRLAAWRAGVDWRQLAGCLVPIAAICLFLGLSQKTVLFLHGEGASLGWLPGLRGALLGLAVAWSGWLGGRTIALAGTRSLPDKAAALLVWLIPLALAAGHSWAMYFHWTDRYHV